MLFYTVLVSALVLRRALQSMTRKKRERYISMNKSHRTKNLREKELKIMVFSL